MVARFYLYLFLKSMEEFVLIQRTATEWGSEQSSLGRYMDTCVALHCFTQLLYMYRLQTKWYSRQRCSSRTQSHFIISKSNRWEICSIVTMYQIFSFGRCNATKTEFTITTHSSLPDSLPHIAGNVNIVYVCAHIYKCLFLN